MSSKETCSVFPFIRHAALRAAGYGIVLSLAVVLQLGATAAHGTHPTFLSPTAGLLATAKVIHRAVIASLTPGPQAPIRGPASCLSVRTGTSISSMSRTGWAGRICSRFNFLGGVVEQVQEHVFVVGP